MPLEGSHRPTNTISQSLSVQLDWRMSAHSAGHPVTVMYHTGYAPVHPKNVSEEYLSNTMIPNYYQTTVPPTQPEYQYHVDNIPYTMSGVDNSFFDYQMHPDCYAHEPVHNTSSYPIPTGSFPYYAYKCSSYPGSVDGRSGSLSSLSSIGSVSSFSPSQFSDHSITSNSGYPDMACHHPHQSEMQSSYAVRNALMHSAEAIDIAHQFGPGASFVDGTSQSIAVPTLPAPTFQVPYLPPRPAFQSHALVPQPTRPIPVQRRLFEQQPHFDTFGVDQQPQPIHRYSLAHANPIPLYEPQPCRLNQAPLFVDESPHQPSTPLSAELFPLLKSPILGSLARKFQPDPVSVSPTIISTQTAATSSTYEDDDEALLLRASTGILRRPWPCKYENQVFTSEDMKLPAAKRRRIYINSLEQACNQVHALLQQHGLLPPPPLDSQPRRSYLPRDPRPKETKLSVIKAQYETTMLRDRLAFLTEMEKARKFIASDEDVVLHPHSEPTFG